MGRKTDFVKSKLHDIKTKFDYATHAGSKFEQKVKKGLETCILAKYNECAEKNNWSTNDLRFNGSATDYTLTITISAPKPKTEPPTLDALIQSVIDEAKNALKSAAKTNKTAISKYNWTAPTVTCLPNQEKSIITIKIIGDAKTPKTSK